MSDSENKSGPPSANKRRRRRRKPAGAAGEPSASPGVDSGPSTGPSSSGTAKSKRRRGARTKGSGGEARRSGGASGTTDADAKRSRSRRTGGGQAASAPDTTRPNREPRSAPRSAPSRTREPAGPAREQPRLRSPEPSVDDLTPAPQEPAIRWGDDSDAPTPDVLLAADLPANAPGSDWDPTTASLTQSEGGYEGPLSARVCNVIGVRFASAGRIYMYDAGDGYYDKGDDVIVEGDHGQRRAVVAAASCRRLPPRTLKRILRRGTPEDRRDDSDSEALQAHLGTAKALAKKLSLPIKVFRATFEDDNKKLAIYYSCDDKTDVRPLSRALSDALPVRVDLRHTGVRDEAKLVGGIGACGQELCCTTWLPSFVPVSIKHAKDQGLALNPTKISGQCGRLKCCLVYEQENYAKLRKGLPKLGKRVITNDGFEGRVIELDVLHQRIRVSVGRGESKVYQKGEVEPLFASQAQGTGNKKTSPSRAKDRHDGSDDNNTDHDNDNDNDNPEEPDHDEQ